MCPPSMVVVLERLNSIYFSVCLCLCVLFVYPSRLRHFIYLLGSYLCRNDHTIVTAPLPVCSAKLSTIWLGQYYGGGPRWNPQCCSFFIFACPIFALLQTSPLQVLSREESSESKSSWAHWSGGTVRVIVTQPNFWIINDTTRDNTPSSVCPFSKCKIT